jgi:glucosamine-6-phosphate deaminase
MFTFKEYTPEILIFNTPEEVDAYVAEQIIEQVQQKPDAVLTLPTGSTPLGTYQKLVEAFERKEVDFGHVTTLNLDEYWPIKKSHPSSYARYMDDHFFRHVNVSPENRHIPNGEASDAGAEAARYESVLMRYEIDLGLISLGPGRTCHIGFNERGSAIDSRVRYVSLDDETKKANTRFFDDASEMPTGAITQGVADILEANQILFVAKGEHKAWGVKRTLTGPIHSDAPASFLRTHQKVTVILDKAAAGLLV